MLSLCMPWRNTEREEIYLHFFLTLSTKWRWVVSIIPQLLYPQYPLNRRLSGSQSCLDAFWRRETSLVPTRNPAYQKFHFSYFVDIHTLLEYATCCLSFVGRNRHRAISNCVTDTGNTNCRNMARNDRVTRFQQNNVSRNTRSELGSNFPWLRARSHRSCEEVSGI